MKRFYIDSEKNIIEVSKEDNLDEDIYTRLPVYFKSQSITGTYDPESILDGYSYYFISELPFVFSVELYPIAFGKRVINSGESILNESFIPVESHLTTGNQMLIKNEFLNDIYISSYNVSIDGLKPNYIKLFANENELNEFIINEQQENKLVTNKLYETYLEFLWSVKFGTPCLQSFLKDNLYKLYNKDFNFIYLPNGEAVPVLTVDYQSYSIIPSTQYIIKIRKIQEFVFEIIGVFDRSVHMDNGTSIVDANFLKKNDSIVILKNISGEVWKYKWESYYLSIVDVDLDNLRYTVDKSLDDESLYYAAGVGFLIKDCFKTGITKENTKDGLYNDILIIDNIENPHIFSSLPNLLPSLRTKSRRTLSYPVPDLTESNFINNGFNKNNIIILAKDYFNGLFNEANYLGSGQIVVVNDSGSEIFDNPDCYSSLVEIDSTTEYWLRKILFSCINPSVYSNDTLPYMCEINISYLNDMVEHHKQIYYPVVFEHAIHFEYIMDLIFVCISRKIYF